MMIRGLYVVASSAISENKRMDIIANNIANVSTTGYKKDTLLTESFPEILISKIGPNPFDKDVLAARGDSGVYSTDENGIFSASTKNGFFQVQTTLGTANNKSIKFKVNDDGYLTTPKGDYILGQNGPIFAGSDNIEIDNLGRIFADGNEVGRLKVVNPRNVIGNFSYGIHADEVVVNFQQGQLHPTDNPLDLAIQGNGFFTVETPNGERYTRNGEFTLNSEGYLVTKEGYMVLGENGYIRLESKSISINESGEVLDNGASTDKLKMVDFNDYKQLSKEGDGLFKMRVQEDLETNLKAFEGKINQGFIEGSNVNSVKQMVEMITVLRSYEASQRLIRTHDEMLGKSVNDIGRV
ncbi:MAG: flagellar hook-basal body protein [Bacillota bacterium]